MQRACHSRSTPFAALEPVSSQDHCGLHAGSRMDLQRARGCLVRSLARLHKDKQSSAVTALAYLRLGLIEVRLSSRGVRHVERRDAARSVDGWQTEWSDLASAPAALAPLHSALQLQPSCMPAHYALGLALLPHGPRDFSLMPQRPLAISAAEAFHRAAAIAPHNEDMWLKQVAVLLRARAASDAELAALLRKAVAARPTSPSSLQQLVSVLQWQGRAAEAEATAARAVREGVWELASQRPARFEAGLRASPFWHANRAAPGVCRRLRQRHASISREFDSLLRAGGCIPQDEGLHTKNSTWSQCEVLARCAAFDPALRATCTALLASPRVVSARFSVLQPGAVVRPHTGTSNRRLVLHYGVRVPVGVLLRAGMRWRPFAHRGCLVFDDSFEHEVRHLGATARVTLVLQVLHPQVAERRTIQDA